ncbi:MAG TPA: PD-(D/E)XK nuclease family protein [Solirubrobacteraceae bacterium]|nr:PD-(D/E)XK nuclease family protein [Solirubrobacteraceae bacterium]
MPLQLITGPANSGKARLALDAVRGHLAREREVLLVVPHRGDRATYLRELAGDGAALGVTVATFSRLEHEIAASAAAGLDLLDEVARDALLAACLAAAGARYVTPQLIAGAGELVAALRAKRVGTAQLSRALAAAGGAPAALDLVALYERYQQGLGRIGAADREQWLRSAQDALRLRPELWRERPVVVYGFDDFTDAQLATIETLGAVVDAPLTVTLTYEPGRDALAARGAAFQALASFASEHVALDASDAYYGAGARGALAHVERHLFEPHAPPVDPGDAVELIAAPTRRAELEAAVERVAALIDDGVAAHEIAIVARRPATVAHLAHDLLERAAIPHSIVREIPLTGAALGRAILGLLACAAGQGSAGDLVAWLRSPGFVRAAGRVDDFEREVRQAGVATAADALALWRGQPRNERFQLEKVDALAAARSARSLYRLVEGEVEQLLLAPLRGAGRPLEDERALEVAAARAVGVQIAALRRLADHDETLAPRDAGALRDALATVTIDAGRAPAEGLVQLTSPQQLRARRVAALILVDMQEGAFPLADTAARLLSDRRLAALANAGLPVLFGRSETLDVERYLFYAAVSRAAERLILCWHEHDAEGRRVNRSLFVDDLLDLFAPPPPERRPSGQAAGDELLCLASAATPLSAPRVLAAIGELDWSATALESWHRCPVQWFVEKFLAADEPAAAGAALTEGSVMHAVLHDVLAELKEHGDARLGPATGERAIAAMRTALADREAQLPGGGALARITRRRLEANLAAYLEHACEDSPAYVPEYLETGFGARSAEGAEPFDLGGGVNVTGMIDRVDVGDDGSALVWDYKRKGRGTAFAGAKWVESGSLQAAIYARAVEAVLGLDVRGALYQPLSGSDGLRPRGAITAEAADGIELVSTDVVDRETFDARIAAAVDAAIAAAGQARAGLLEPRPRQCFGQCRYRAICRIPR